LEPKNEDCLLTCEVEMSLIWRSQCLGFLAPIPRIGYKATHDMPRPFHSVFPQAEFWMRDNAERCVTFGENSSRSRQAPAYIGQQTVAGFARGVSYSINFFQAYGHNCTSCWSWIPQWYSFTHFWHPQ
jgi:hypothetical protein